MERNTNDLKRNMKENFVTGTSRYPESPEAVLRILNAYQPPAGWNRRKQDTGAGTEEGTMFAQAEGGDDSWKARINCHKCGKKGHIARKCPKKEEEQLNAKLHCRAPFGSYCETHEDPDITNTLDPRTKWGICMGPTGNLQGSYKFLSLSTGKNGNADHKLCHQEG